MLGGRGVGREEERLRAGERGGDFTQEDYCCGTLEETVLPPPLSTITLFW